MPPQNKLRQEQVAFEPVPLRPHNQTLSNVLRFNASGLGQHAQSFCRLSSPPHRPQPARPGRSGRASSAPVAR